MHTDILVIGTGISGLSYAIKLAELSPSTQITLICKDTLNEGNTRYAQGGIAVVSNFKKDSFEKHIEDTWVAGDYQGDKDVIRFVVEEGNDRLQELIDWGTSFDTKNKNNLDLGKEGGHSENRIVHHKDSSGMEIQRALIEKIKSLENIQYLENHFLVDLITDHHSKANYQRCYGAYIISTLDEKIIKITAKLTVLSTGGAGQLYSFTTNPEGATADGLGAAYRAKVLLKNLPYIQFHPTALHPKVENETFLITEAVRGKGGILKDNKGHAFMHNYDPRKDLAPRDIVARAITQEILNSDQEYVFLDTTHFEKGKFKHDFPMIYSTCLSVGIDPEQEGIPVVPAAHYSCGGIQVDAQAKTSLQGLYAIGECSHTGLHGANRLASNSLLESIVYAHRAAMDSVKALNEIDLELTFFNSIPEWNGQEFEADISYKKTQLLIDKLKTIMTEKAGIFKTTKGLDLASKELEDLYHETLHLYNNNKLTAKLCELRNMVSVAYVLINQARQIKENKGVFYNNDYVQNVL